MTPRQFHDLCVMSGLSLLPPVMTSPEARVLLVAIAMQETGLVTRSEVGGSAFGFYQFMEIGVDGVFSHAETGHLAADVAKVLQIPIDENFYEAVRWNDHMGTVLARLNLWPDPAPLPALGQEMEAFRYYERIWRPKVAVHARWPAAYNAGMACAA